MYLDDVLVFYPEIKQSLYSRLAEAQAAVTLAKCEFSKATVRYLGRVVWQVRYVRWKEKFKLLRVIPYLRQKSS